MHVRGSHLARHTEPQRPHARLAGGGTGGFLAAFHTVSSGEDMEARERAGLLRALGAGDDAARAHLAEAVHGDGGLGGGSTCCPSIAEFPETGVRHDQGVAEEERGLGAFR